MEGIILHIIYGSQTGQAKAIAEVFSEEAEVNGCDVKLMPMSEAVLQIPWTSSPYLIFITSSTGDGEPPENAMKFYKILKNPSLPSAYLSHVKFALLGLGDSNYTTFGGFPKALHKRFLELGAREFYPTDIADDAVGLENVVEPWKEGLWSKLENLCKSDESVSSSATSDDLVPVPANGQPIESVPESQAEIPSGEAASALSSSNEPSTVENDAFDSPTLQKSVPPLSDKDIRVPALPPSFINCGFDTADSVDCSVLPFQNGAALPLAAGPVHFLPVVQSSVLTRSDADKKAMEITIDLTGTGIHYEPGDSLAVICPNAEDDVMRLLAKIGLSDKANTTMTLSVRPEALGGKKRVELPVFLPPRATPKHVLMHCVDIRSPPKKPLLRVLADYTTDKGEQRRLKELCSLEGAEDYVRYVREPHLSLLDVLLAFPSCQPPFCTLLEQSSRLLPRPYSYCSSQLADPALASFVFKVLRFGTGNGRQYERKGVATGYLDELFGSHSVDLLQGVANLSLSGPERPKLVCYQRLPSMFRLPEDPSVPLILVGPGSGVAPFVGFARHREAQLRANPHMSLGPIWLFFGCRHRDRDFLYRKELVRLYNLGVLSHFLACFSKSQNQSGDPVYVQDLISRERHSIVRLLMDKNASFYVCGDANHMAKDVMNCVISAIADVESLSLEEAKKVVLNLQSQKRYLQDIWA